MEDLIQIKEVVEDSYGGINISSKTRKMPYPDAVKVYCYIANKCLKNDSALKFRNKYSRRIIGKYINRDHCTVTVAIKRCDELMGVDNDFRQRVRFCLQRSANILNKKTTAYKNKIDVVFTKLSNSQQEELYIKAIEMYAFNSDLKNLKEEINYVQ